MIEDYYYDITVLDRTKVDNGAGGWSEAWTEIAIVQGVINRSTPNTSFIGGKVTEMSEYKALTELNDYIKAHSRLKDSDGKVYRVNGKPKDCIKRGHHLAMDLDYYDQDNGVVI